MSIKFKPPSVNIGADPGLQYLSQREVNDAYSSVNGHTGTAIPNTNNVVVEQFTNYITNVSQLTPSDTVLDISNINETAVTKLGTNLTATIITAEPQVTDRTIRMAPANTMTGHRLIIINRSPSHHLIVEDELLNTVVVVDCRTSEEILSDGYSWIAVN
jgi:hypothetical protein